MKFSMWPAEKADEALDMWTQAFCFTMQDGLPIIRFDKEKKQYWMTSDKGNAIDNNRLNLGERRNVAYKQFELNNLRKDVEKRIKEIKNERGSDFVKETLDSLRGIGNSRYKDMYAYPNMNPEEVDALESHNDVYEATASLVESEIKLRTKQDKR